MQHRYGLSRGALPPGMDRHVKSHGPAQRARSRERRGFVPRLMALEERQLLSAGDLDPTFNPAGTPPGTITFHFGTLGGNDTAEAVAIQPDNKIVVGGSANIGGNIFFALARFLPNGQFDPTFGVGGLDGDGIVTTKVIGNKASIHAIAADVRRPNRRGGRHPDQSDRLGQGLRRGAGTCRTARSTRPSTADPWSSPRSARTTTWPTAWRSRRTARSSWWARRRPVATSRRDSTSASCDTTSTAVSTAASGGWDRPHELRFGQRTGQRGGDPGGR